MAEACVGSKTVNAAAVQAASVRRGKYGCLLNFSIVFFFVRVALQTASEQSVVMNYYLIIVIIKNKIIINLTFSSLINY